jgi:UDP-glucose 4-epimerase
VVALVTGYAGFLGGHSVAALAADGWQVTVAGHPEMDVPSPTFDALLRRQPPQLVVHCAGPASVPAAEEDPADDRRRSVDVVASLLDRVAALPEARLVLVSSAAVYGEPATLPVTVDAPVSPISVYGRHRAECEELARASGVSAVIARVFSAYGEGLKRQVWWDIARAAQRGDPVALHGTGAESRDFVHGEDVGRALATIASKAQFDGEAYNIATSTETTIAELAGALVNALDSPSEVTFSGKGRRGDPLRWRADTSAARALGFEPAVAISNGIDRYARWVLSGP